MNMKAKGMAYAITASFLWGMSGTVVQSLFQMGDYPAEWLVGLRMLAAGAILTIYGMLKSKKDTLAIWKNKKDRIQLIIFGILGMSTVQYTYFMAIQAGNAATATVLQFIGPVIIACYQAVKMRKMPRPMELLAVFCALGGILLLSTHGRLNGLAVAPEVLFWGIVSAFALAFYTLYPGSILKKYGAVSVVGWGMLIGGGIFQLFHPVWKIQEAFTFQSILSILVIIIIGTLFGYLLFLQSLLYIQPSVSSLLTSVEPLTASVLSILFLNVKFKWYDWAGTGLILSTVFLLSLVKEKPGAAEAAGNKSVSCI